jgi:ABC-type lipoprotein release transport system permease subunit
MSIAGFILLSICMGIAAGGYDKIIDLIVRDQTGHVQIHKKGYLDRPSLYNTINSPELLIKRVNSFSFVSASAPRIYSEVLAFADKKTVGVRITGIDPEMEGQTTRLKFKVAKGRFISNLAKNEVLISDSLAKALNTGIGDKIILIGQCADGSIANDQFNIVGINSGQSADFGAMNCYMHIKKAQEFLFLLGRVHEIAIILHEHSKAEKAAEKLTNKLNDNSLCVEPWQVVKKEFYQAMQTDLIGQRLSFVILMIVVGIGVLDTVIMTILERTSEFGLLKAMGTRPRDIIKLIVGETAALSFVGIFFGFTIAFAINLYLSKNGIYLSEPLYFGGVYMEKIESTISFHVFWIPALLTFITSMVVCIFPACRAAYMPPVKAINL